MQRSPRVKRRAAAAAALEIIDILDSDDNESLLEPLEKRTRVAPNRRIDQAANKLTAGCEQRQRWPTKGREAKGRREKSVADVENRPQNSNVLEETSTEHPVTSTHGSAQSNRNSFAGRRQAWTLPSLLAESQNIPLPAASQIVQLFESDNTIPFICRYRRDLVNHMTPERLREIKNTYTALRGLRTRAEGIVAQLERDHDIPEEVRHEMMCAKSSEELEFLYAPYKPANKGSLADRAKALGLEECSDHILYGESPPVRSLDDSVQYDLPELDSVEKVAEGICHIIAHKMSKHTSILEELRRLQRVHRIMLKSTKAKETAAAKSKASTAASRASKGKAGNSSSSSEASKSRNDAMKYEMYFDYQNDVRYLKPHQVLAINRGEKAKYLTVKLIIPEHFKTDLTRFAHQLFLDNGMRYAVRNELMQRAFEECYTKKLQPLVTRQIRSDLNDVAKQASIDVFAKNLKQLLLISPLQGERILGIDPGFTNGCKLALISESADVLETGVIYPHVRSADPEECGMQLAKLLARHNCHVIALGNGTACRETEFWLTKLFHAGILDGEQVRYSIVSEQGASIYSCSEVARREFPQMDVNEISAVSIARRLNDPLSEYVKIDARHIGVGMYQHDINEKALAESLDEVVSECVSFVGVDLNTASLSVLKHIAGLSEKKAEKIIDYRTRNGPFRTRKDLLAVKSVGEKTFVQCAGFVRIEPLSIGGRLENELDRTWVHPESYVVANKVISKCRLKLSNIGEDDFIAAIDNFRRTADLGSLAREFQIPVERLEVVLQALQRPLTKDYRADLRLRPLFKHGLTRLNELSVGDVVTGAVTNVTHFGAFVDIGVEIDGLIHSSKLQNRSLAIGDRVTASIEQLNVERRRIGLRLETALQETDSSFTFA